jgi:hypothetical protein
MRIEKTAFVVLVCTLFAGLAFLAFQSVSRQPVAFFAYGANLAKSAMNARAGGFINATEADLPRYELVFASQDARPAEFGVATPIPNDSSNVLGALYYLTPEQVAVLDRQAGVPTFYERREVDIFLGGKIVRAQAYFLAGSTHQAYPSRTYYLSMQRGLEEWGYTQYAESLGASH